jgi:hypothetical protein
VTEAHLLIRRGVIVMWIATAVTFGLNVYAALAGNPVLIGVGLGVALSYAVAGIAFGCLAACTSARHRTEHLPTVISRRRPLR